MFYGSEHLLKIVFAEFMLRGSCLTILATNCSSQDFYMLSFHNICMLNGLPFTCVQYVFPITISPGVS